MTDLLYIFLIILVPNVEDIVGSTILNVEPTITTTTNTSTTTVKLLLNPRVTHSGDIQMDLI